MSEAQKRIVRSCPNWARRLDIARAMGYKKVFPDFIRSLESLSDGVIIEKTQDVLPNGVIRYWYRATPQAIQDAMQGASEGRQDVQLSFA